MEHLCSPNLSLRCSLTAHNDPGSFHYTYQIEQFFKPTSSWKTVRIFAYSSMREQSNKGSGTRLKTESETGEDLRNALPISLLILRKNQLLCSLTNIME